MTMVTNRTTYLAIRCRFLNALEHACDLGEALQGLIAQAELQVDRARVRRWTYEDRRLGRMAGSYNHCVTRNGNLMSNDRMMISGAMIENLGDAYEAIEEMFGMIWWLAYKLDGPSEPEDLSHEDRVRRYEDVKLAVEEARQNYKQGLETSRDIHAIAPDNRRD